MLLKRKEIGQALIFINLAVLLISPQLNNVHYDPLPQFFAEITVAFAIITLFIITCCYTSKITIPKVTIFLGLFAVFIGLQQFVVHIDFIGLSYTAALELFLCILLAISISSIITTYGLTYFTQQICSILVFGVLLQSIIGLIQYLGLSPAFHGVIFYDPSHPTTDIFGHFGQRNHYCHYLTWGVFGLVYLYIQQKIKLNYFIPLLLWLIFSITISGSRSVFMYFFLAIIISGIYYLKIIKHKQDTHDAKNLFITILCVSMALALFEYLYPLLQHLLSHHEAISSGIERLTSNQVGAGGLTGRRMVEWHKAWIIFKKHPIFGYGFNEYAKQSVLLQPLFPHAPLNDGLFTNCHNLILQLLAETGLIGTGLVIIGLISIIYSITKTKAIEVVIILCMLFTTLAHSMVEYPLWYFYFLAPFIMFLSIDKPIGKIRPSIALSIFIVPSLVIMYLSIQSITICNLLTNYNAPPSQQSAFTSQAKFLDSLAKKSSFWAYPALYSLDNYIIVDSKDTNNLFNLNEQLEIENRFTNFHPYPDNLIKQAKLNFNLGNHKLAESQVRLALVAYPVYKSSFLQSLRSKTHKYAKLYRIVYYYKY